MTDRDLEALESLIRATIDIEPESQDRYGYPLPATLTGVESLAKKLAARLQPARVPEGYALVPSCLAGQLSPGYWREVWTGTKKRKLTITLDDAYWSDVMSRLAAAPAPESAHPAPEAQADESGKYGDLIIERDERGLIQRVYRVGVIGKKLVATNPEYVADPHPAPPAAGQSEGVDIELAGVLADEIEPYASNGGQYVVDAQTAPTIVEALRRLASQPASAGKGVGDA